MFLTITASSDRTGAPATDLGYLLHKHPDRAQKFGLPVGTAHVFYPQADATTCTAALLLEVDPIALVRGRGPRPLDGFSLAQYVNDRPYAASSMLAVALGKVFRTAISGRCEARPDLVGVPMRLDVHVPALPCRGGAEVARRMFEPLGWTTRITPVPLDEELGWGDSRYLDLRLSGEAVLAEALAQLYVLLPVLDDAKHYWVSPDEVDKLIRAGEGWLAGHPERTLITERYLRHRRRLVDDATERFAGLEDLTVPDDETELPADVADLDPEPTDAPGPAGADLTDASGPVDPNLEDARGPVGTELTNASGPVDPNLEDARGPVDLNLTGVSGPVGSELTDTVAAVASELADRPVSLATLRLQAVVETLQASGAQSVADLGCGEGKLLKQLLGDTRYQRLLGVDVSHRSLGIAARRLRLERLPERARARIDLRQSSLVYTDPDLAGFDAAVLMEVIEHVDVPRLPALASNVFGTARPGVVLVTTPNVEYNAHYGIVDGDTRHTDHRFEWDRAQFQAWATAVAEQYGYTVRFKGVGDEDPEAGPPTQMAVFTHGFTTTGSVTTATEVTR